MTTFVLIHGSYQGGWIWQRVAGRLHAAGHTVYAPTLDGCAERKHQVRAGITTETHAAEIAEMLFYEDLRCGHGWHEFGRHGPLPRRRSGARANRPRGVGRCPDAVRRRADPRHRSALDGHAQRAHRGAFTRGCGNPSVCRSRPEDPRLGPGAIYAPSDRDLRAPGASAEILDTAMGGDGGLVPPRRKSGRGPSASHRRAPQGEMVRARHRPLSDAQHAGGADRAADPVETSGPSSLELIGDLF